MRKFGVKISRIICTLSIVAAVLFPGPSKEGSEFEIIRLNERVLILQNRISRLNMTVIDAGDCVMIIDTFPSPLMAAHARRIIETEFHKPITYVFNTHHHWDHTFGNEVFKEAIIVGHRFCAEDMRRDYTNPEEFIPGLEISGLYQSESENQAIADWLAGVRRQIQSGFLLTPPNLLVNERYSIPICDLTVQLYHAPGLHTRSLLTLFIPELGLVFSRSCLHHNSLPSLQDGVEMDKLCGCLEDILRSGMPVEYLIPGYGNPLEAPGFNFCLEYLKNIQKVVTQARKEGKSLYDAESMFLGDYYISGEEQYRTHLHNMRILWDIELMKE